MRKSVVCVLGGICKYCQPKPVPTSTKGLYPSRVTKDSLVESRSYEAAQDLGSFTKNQEGSRNQKARAFVGTR